jgi:type VI secretion system protein ImpH
MLHEQPYSFSFFQAVRLLEMLHPEREPVGHFVTPASEVVHFRALPSMAFPASEIQSLHRSEGEPEDMTVNFLGLTGPSGVLPLYYTEFLMSRERERDTGLRDFFDIFNHRLISFFYQAWRKYRLSPASISHEGDISSHILSLIGLGTTGLRNRLPFPDDLLIYYAGLLMKGGRSASALKQIIADYFDIEVQVEEFAGSWQKLEPEMQTCLSEDPGEAERLGYGAIAGDEIWQDESTIRLKLGPLRLQQYLEFLPSGEAHKILKAMTQFFSSDEIDFEVQLVLHPDEVPRCELGAEGETAPRLGWLAWMKSRPFQHEAGDTILTL